MSTGDFHVKIMSQKSGLKKGRPIEIPPAKYLRPTLYLLQNISHIKNIYLIIIIIILIYYTTIVIRQYFENIRNLNNCLLHY